MLPFSGRPSAPILACGRSREVAFLIVHVHENSSITLDEADTFTAFAPNLGFGQIVAAFGCDAKVGEDDHLWISIPDLHTLGAIHGGADWRKGCDDMLGFAASKGWVDEARQLVRAHIER